MLAASPSPGDNGPVARQGVAMAGRKAKPLTVEQILVWAEAHFARTGKWPSSSSGEVVGVPGRHWGTIDRALRDGVGGLPGRDSLARLLVRHRR
jgi:hypothetical protein